MLEPHHAGAIYRLLHRGPVLVVAFSSVWVRRDPRRDPPRKRAALRLETFVEHKGLHGLVRSDKHVDEIFDQYVAWSAQVNCTGENDPRVLPLHVFETARTWPDLGTPPGDNRFVRAHGPPRRRVDEGRKSWSRAASGAYHGGGALIVAGSELAQGMHWDVSIERGTAVICGADGVWALKGRNAYVNVHPDAHVRETEHSRRLWSPGLEK
jgi:hypothetical protein